MLESFAMDAKPHQRWKSFASFMLVIGCNDKLFWNKKQHSVFLCWTIWQARGWWVESYLSTWPFWLKGQAILNHSLSLCHPPRKWRWSERWRGSQQKPAIRNGVKLTPMFGKAADAGILCNGCKTSPTLKKFRFLHAGDWLRWQLVYKFYPTA